MDLKGYYRLVSSEGRAKKYLLGKCFKTLNGCALSANAESFINCMSDGIVTAVLIVNKSFGSSSEGGSTKDD